MRIIAITQARTGSTRFPGKVLMDIDGDTVLGLHLKRILKSKKVNKVIVATTINVEDQTIVDLCSEYPVKIYRGSVDDVLDRFYCAAQLEKNIDYVVRLTSDCPLIDPELIDKIVSFTTEQQLDYCSNTLTPSYPDGQDIEVFRYSTLEKAWKQAKLKSEREHVTPYIWKNSTYGGVPIFRSANFSEGMSYGHLRMTVDEKPDLEVIKKLIAEIGKEVGWLAYAQCLEQNIAIKDINRVITRNEGYMKSTNNDNP